MVGNIDLERDFGWAPDLVKGAYYVSHLKPCNLIIASGKKYSLRKILDYAFKIKKLDYKKFIKTNKLFYRKYEEKNVFPNMEYSLKKLKRFNWKPRTYGKKLILKIYNDLK